MVEKSEKRKNIERKRNFESSRTFSILYEKALCALSRIVKHTVE